VYRAEWRNILKREEKMNREDPLDTWLFLRNVIESKPEVVAQRQAEAHDALDRLTDLLDHPPVKWADLNRSGLWGWGGAMGLAPTDLTRAQELYQRVYATGGPGNSSIQGSLLDLIAATDNPTSIPFWVELLDLSRPRDSFTVKRQTLSLAALARLAIGRDVPAAYEALRGAARHVRPEVRAQALHYLGRVHLETERPLPPEVVADLADIAVHDTAFGPRFQARAVLRDAELPVPLDNPGGVYALKVKFMRDKHIYRTIELKSEQTLDDLHFAIQQAIRWDADHLYSFYLNGQLYDERYEFSCPENEDSPSSTDEGVIGELGLVMKHRFLYYFDYGDSHQFEVEVIDIRPQAARGKYPRMVDSQGKAPRQYEQDDW
jgi:hypothetical protein